MSHTYNLAEFTEIDSLLQGQVWVFVVKSCDQMERRQRMLNALDKGKVMGLEPRSVAQGLVFTTCFNGKESENAITQKFLEPRHIKKAPNGDVWLTTIDKLYKLDENMKIAQTIEHDLFSFLHTLDFNADGTRVLVCATGYDSIIEIDLRTGQETYRWMAWEYGFNPDQDGIWLTLDKDTAMRYASENLPHKLVTPSKDPQGIMMKHCTSHPNVAVYNPYKDDGSFLVSIAWSGTIYMVNRETGKAQPVSRFNAMPHGLAPFEGGWMVTDTTSGRWVAFDRNWNCVREVVCSALPGKVTGSGDKEWLQIVLPYEKDKLLLLDANRGIIAVDLATKTYALYRSHPNYCIQDAMKLSL